jgi:hypothetical protein
VLLDYNAILRAPGKPPSKAAKSAEFLKSQANPSLAIHDGRSNPGSNFSTIAPPIQIFHPIFHEFTQFVNDPLVQPTVEDLDNVHQLMQTLSSIYKKEDAYREKVRRDIARILDTTILEMANPDNTRPDGFIMAELGNTPIPCALFELKREAGEGGCDPTSQASFSMKRAWIHEAVGYNRIHLDPVFDF